MLHGNLERLLEKGARSFAQNVFVVCQQAVNRSLIAQIAAYIVSFAAEHVLAGSILPKITRCCSVTIVAPVHNKLPTVGGL
jgi:hypothetical protein